MKALFHAVVLVAGLSLSVPATFAQYPTKSIRLVVPFPPGGTADVVARILAQPVGQTLGQSIVVDNRAGADGALAGTLVMHAAADGYTIFFASNSPMSAVPALHRNPPYDPRTDFTPITFIGRFTFYLFVNPNLPVRTLAELIDYARANPGKLNYGSGNTTAIVTMAQLAMLAGLEMTHVPYKGDAPTTADLIAGRIQLAMMTPVPALAQAKEGRVRMLAALLAKRSALAPEVPTMAEAGMPGVSVTPWGGLFGPANMPRPVVEQLSKAFNAALERPEVQEQLARQGFEGKGSTPEQLADIVREQLVLWRRVIREAKIPVE